MCNSAIMLESGPFREKGKTLPPSRLRTSFLLAALTLAAFLIAGYHPATQDDAIYLAAIQHRLNPALFPADAAFVLPKMPTLFVPLIALLVRFTRLPVAPIALACHLLSIFAILAACYRIASRCFQNAHARWCGVALVAVLLTRDISGTALCLVDPYLYPRAIATALLLFAIDCVLVRRFLASAALLAAAFLIHPLMAAFGLSLCLLLSLPLPIYSCQTQSRPHCGTRLPATLLAVALPLGWLLHPDSASPALRQAIAMHHYCVLSSWTGREWIEVLVPLVLLPCFARLGRRSLQPAAQAIQDQAVAAQATLVRLSLGLALYAVLQLALALVLMLPPALERLRPLEPMRYLHLLYLLTILLGGCLLGDYVLRRHRWRWSALFLLLALKMFFAERAAYPASPHLELPGVHSSSPWIETFAWIRTHTPEEAYFALGADYLRRPGEDCHGFRALALRSALADNVKDSGVVMTLSSSSALADRWQREVAAQSPDHRDWRHITAADLQSLKARFGVTWVVLEQPADPALTCPYRNQTLEVCRL